MEAKSGVPKRAEPRRAEHELRGKTWTVTLVHEVFSASTFPGVPPFREVVRASSPVLVAGWCLPATFDVEYEGLTLRMTLENVAGPRKVKWAPTVLEIKSSEIGGEIEEVPRLPLASFVRSAVQLSSLTCVQYPPNYEGPTFADKSLTKTVQNVVIRTDEAGGTFSLGWADQTTTDHLVDLLGGATSKKNAISVEKLRIVRRVDLETPRGKGKYAAIDAALRAAGEYAGSVENVKKLVKRARTADEAGELYPKKSQRGKK